MNGMSHRVSVENGKEEGGEDDMVKGRDSHKD